MSAEKFPNPVGVSVGRAMNEELLRHILDPMRRVARDAGYAIAVHGSLARDIDLIAVPWAEFACATDPDFLVNRLCAVIAGITGRCNPMKDWTDKPHGRRAKTILVWNDRFHTDIDLSVMPCLEKEPETPAPIAEKACKNKRKKT